MIQKTCADKPPAQKLIAGVDNGVCDDMARVITSYDDHQKKKNVRKTNVANKPCQRPLMPCRRSYDEVNKTTFVMEANIAYNFLATINWPGVEAFGFVCRILDLQTRLDVFDGSCDERDSPARHHSGYAVAIHWQYALAWILGGPLMVNGVEVVVVEQPTVDSQRTQHHCNDVSRQCCNKGRR